MKFFAVIVRIIHLFKDILSKKTPGICNYIKTSAIFLIGSREILISDPTSPAHDHQVIILLFCDGILQSHLQIFAFCHSHGNGCFYHNFLLTLQNIRHLVDYFSDIIILNDIERTIIRLCELFTR